MEVTVPPPTLILTQSDVRAVLTLRDCIAAVEAAFCRHAEGQTLPPGILGVPATGGGFHIKAAGLRGARGYFAAKTNANFPENPRRFGLPTIQGTIVLCDAEHGAPLAVMDSALVTALRTAAATAVAAKWLARPGARSAAIIGCGAQGGLQLAAVAEVLRIERAWAVDVDVARAEALASEAKATLGLDVEVVEDARTALREADSRGGASAGADTARGDHDLRQLRDRAPGRRRRGGRRGESAGCRTRDPDQIRPLILPRKELEWLRTLRAFESTF